MFRYLTLLSSKRKKRQNLSLLICIVILGSCAQPSEKDSTIITMEDLNPAAPGFDSINSDSKAIKWADAVMQAMGGRKKWDETRYISWNFFGRRNLWWDKYSGDVRIESSSDSTAYLLNVNSGIGKVRIKGNEISDPDSLKRYLQRGKSIWINDSYWLVMPFKLKDSGVTLKYLREDSTMEGKAAHVLGMTFKNVGDTPDNKYEVYITKSDSLVKQWAFYGTSAQDSASAIWPWDNYKSYNGLMLSSDRSDDKGPHNVQVFDNLDSEIFTNFNWKKEDE